MTRNRAANIAANDRVDITRRHFLTVSAGLGGGLLIGFTTSRSISAVRADEKAANTPFAPNAFIRIDPTVRSR